MLTIKNNTERDLIATLERGGTYTLAETLESDQRTIRAELIAAIFLKIPIAPAPDESAQVCHPRRGIRINNAIIDGNIILSDSYLEDNEYGPALIFENCIIRSTLDICGIYLSKLELTNTQLESLRANGCKVANGVTLQEIGPITEDKAPGNQVACHVELSNANIQGDLNLSNVTLRLSKNSPQDLAYGLEMMRSSINGRIVIDNCNIASGISLQDAIVRDDIWVMNSALGANPTKKFSINAQSLKIDGSFFMRRHGKDHQDKTIDGNLFFSNSRIRGILEIQHISFSSQNDNNHIALIHAEVHAISIENNIGNITALLFENARVINDIILGRSSIAHIQSNGITVEGNLDIKEVNNLKHVNLASSKLGTITLTDNSCKIEYLILNNSEINNNAIFYNTYIKNFVSKGVTLQGDLSIHEIIELNSLDLSSSVIQGNVHLKCLDGIEKIDSNNMSVGKNYVLTTGLKAKANTDEEDADQVFNNAVGTSGNVGATEKSMKQTSFDFMLSNSRIAGSLTVRSKLPQISPDRVLKVIRTAPAFYPELYFYQIIYASDFSCEISQVCFLIPKNELKTDQLTLLDGTSIPIHETNRKYLQLDSKYAKDYLHFFCFNLWSDNGCFEPLPAVEIDSAEKLLHEIKSLFSLDSEKYQNRLKDLLENDIKDDYEKITHALNLTDRINDDEIEQMKSLIKQNDNNDTETHHDILELTKAIWDRVLQDRVNTLFEAGEKIFGINTTNKTDDNGKSYYEIEAPILYGNVIFKSNFKISQNGMVEMLDDQILIELPAYPISYRAPYRSIDNPQQLDRIIFASEHHISDSCELLTKNIFEKIHICDLMEDILQTYHRKKNSQKETVIDLSNTVVNVLNDESGRAWGENNEFHLKIDNLVYKQTFRKKDNNKEIDHEKHNTLVTTWLNIIARCRIELSYTGWKVMNFFYKFILLVTAFKYKNYNVLEHQHSGYKKQLHIMKTSGWLQEEFWRSRLEWLQKQYTPPHDLTVKNYRSQPYEQLYKVYRSQGEHTAARKIKSRQLSLEKKLILNPIKRFFLFLWGLFFGYGLSPGHAIITTMLFISFGWLMVEQANQSRVLVVDTLPSSTIAITENNQLIAGTKYIKGPEAGVSSIPCGNLINPLLYSVDVFIPLLDIRQEFRCHIDPSAKNADIWLMGKAFYTLLGWIVIYATIMTFVNSLRRHE